MTRCLAPSFLLLVCSFAASRPAAAQTSRTLPLPVRAIRRDIPLANSIRRAFAAGTRDSTGRPGRAYWQLRTDYTINARIDTATSRLYGRETIVVHNNGNEPISAIVLRLDHNLFRPAASRSGSIPGEITDGMIVTSLAAAGQAIDLTSLPLDRTVAQIGLPSPIAPHAIGTLEIAWNTKLPGGPGRGHRMTMRWGDTLYQPTQWYPRVAKLDDLRGWDMQSYLGPSEFYNNFGRFDVRLDVPAGWLVSGTGVLQNPGEVLTPTARARLARVTASDSVTTIVGLGEAGPGRATAGAPGGRLVWHFVADTVNDFAWATAKTFVWQATRATIPSRGAVPIHMFYLPGNAAGFADAGAIARHALEFYSTLWIPYPFPQLTMQDGPSNGMEYPMVINSNAGPADHETAHQWWPMMVGNNETRYGWMDEGFNMYMNLFSDADAAHRPAVSQGGGQGYGTTSGDEDEPPMMWNANYAGPMYGFQTYEKTPKMLAMLGGIVGDSAVIRAMRGYTEAWRFKHPSPWDYMFFMNNALKQDLGWFWYYWLFTTESVDGSIQQVATGAKTKGAARTIVTVRQDGQMPSPVVLRVEFAPTGPAIKKLPNTVMVDSATAIVTYPVDVWFHGNRTFTASLDVGGRKVTKITLDPEGRFPDRDATDNVWPRE